MHAWLSCDTAAHGMQGGAGAQELDLIKQRAVDLLGQLPHATDAADEQCWPSGGNALQLQAGTAREHVIEMVLNISCVRGFCAAGRWYALHACMHASGQSDS
jgi:hypothetical protein